MLQNEVETQRADMEMKELTVHEHIQNLSHGLYYTILYYNLHNPVVLPVSRHLELH